jgi:hypothetical protein
VTSTLPPAGTVSERSTESAFRPRGPATHDRTVTSWSASVSFATLVQTRTVASLGETCGVVTKTSCGPT